MKSTKKSIDIQRAIAQIYKRYPVVRDIVHDIHAHGGRAIVVGGAVRDFILDFPIKDVDIEVHGMPLDALEALLNRFGHVSLVGKRFGVLRLHGIDIDWSLPRCDSSGRKPEVIVDPYMTIKDAFARRDLTINALGIDLMKEELLDPFQGIQDIKEKKLRSPNPDFFAEDPLRLFRVMQFIGRFQMEPDETLQELCKKMDISDVSRERIEQEFNKLFLKSKSPSRGIRWLARIGRLQEILPELAATIGVEQDASWHPEGDVFEHSMQALDAAAQLPVNESKRLLLMYAAMLHDIGKVTMSEKQADGSITSHGHAQESAKYAQEALKRITHNRSLSSAVKKLIYYHMVPLQFYDQPETKLSAFKRLANKLAPDVSMQMLADLVLADRRGRNPHSAIPLKDEYEEVNQFKKKADKAQVLEHIELPILLGRDLLDDMEPGPHIGELVKRAYEIQLEEGIKDKDELKRRVITQNTVLKE